jgi:prolyl-tRNA editing enzyme YbaK/EbsC (Cys-tRNA(Pro) deacylase)
MTAPATARPRFATALTASQSAKAIPCNVNQIVKSLVFEVDGEWPLVLIDGASRVDTGLVSAVQGVRRVRKATPGTVRSVTGYEIGGVPPFGHLAQVRAVRSA